MPKQDKSYQDLSAELADVLTKLQMSDIEIDTAVALHARGEEIIAALEEMLQTAENTVNEITGQA